MTHQIEDTRNQILQEIYSRQISTTTTKILSEGASSIVLADAVKNDKIDASSIVLADKITKNSGSNTNNDLQQEPKINLGKAREVLKNKKIEKQKDCSRAFREEHDKICLRPGIGEEQNPEGQNQRELDQIPIVESTALGFGGDSCSEPDEPTAADKLFTGISAQQAKTSSGVKVSLTLQTKDDAEFGAVVKLTGEMKRATRFRELKPYSGDSSEFAELYEGAKQSIRDLDPVSRSEFCLGRIHDSGKRSAWYANMFILGKIDSTGSLINLILMSETETYEIAMSNDKLSTRQKDFYLSAGVYGNLVSVKQVPTIHSAKRVAYNP